MVLSEEIGGNRHRNVIIPSIFFIFVDNFLIFLDLCQEKCVKIGEYL